MIAVPFLDCHALCFPLLAALEAAAKDHILARSGGARVEQHFLQTSSKDTRQTMSLLLM